MVSVLTLPQVAVASHPIVVGFGTPATCTEWALQDALSAAGINEGRDVIQFDCGPDLVTIAITATTILPDGTAVALLPPDGTTIDGGHKVTLRRSDWSGTLLLVAVDTAVILEKLTLESRVAHPDPLGGGPWVTVANAGTLVLRQVVSSVDTAGTQVVNDGTLTVEDSTLSGNGFALVNHPLDPAIINRGKATIDHSLFVGNVSFAGGAIANSGLLDVNNSVFARNSADVGGGGAIWNVGGTVTINNSEFSQNGSAHDGGAVLSFGSLTVTNSTFSNNGARFDGGALFGEAVVRHSKFLANSAFSGGALLGSYRIENSTISGNHANVGGGIFGGVLTIVNSRITANSASAFGGGIAVTRPGSSLTLVRTEVADNTPDDISPAQ
jgi:predicted outer membrane repeat protein